MKDLYQWVPSLSILRTKFSVFHHKAIRHNIGKFQLISWSIYETLMATISGADQQDMLKTTFRIRILSRRFVAPN